MRLKGETKPRKDEIDPFSAEERVRYRYPYQMRHTYA